jgi:hypothetical protein
MRHGIGLYLVLLTAGCPGGSGASNVNHPEQALKNYARALEQGNHDAAYSMMSSEFRKKYTRDDFVAMVRDHNSELKQSISQLKGRPRNVRMEATISFGAGDSLRLVLDNGKWQIASDPVDFYGQRTPAEALRSFVRAIERHRYDVVLRFVPNKWAETMTVQKLREQWEGGKREEVATLLKNLRANLTAPIHRKGDRATMPYGDRFEVRFVREDGVWKIEDPD